MKAISPFYTYCALVLTLPFISCTNRSCYSAIQAKYPEDIAVVRSMLMDTLEAWKSRRLKAFVFADLAPGSLSDTIFPNCDASRLVFLFSLIDPDMTARFDAVQFIGAENATGVWEFYCSPFPSYVFDRTQLAGKRKWTKAEMINAAYDDVVQSGYLNEECEVDCYFWERNNFFSAELSKIHQFYLADSLPVSDTLR